MFCKLACLLLLSAYWALQPYCHLTVKLQDLPEKLSHKKMIKKYVHLTDPLIRMFKSKNKTFFQYHPFQIVICPHMPECLYFHALHWGQDFISTRKLPNNHQMVIVVWCIHLPTVTYNSSSCIVSGKTNIRWVSI